MKPNELRIGNYVNVLGDTKQLRGVSQYNQKHRTQTVLHYFEFDDTIPLKIIHLKPIPLTEDWLLKFGYEYWDTIKTNKHESFKRFVLHNFLGTSNHEVHIITSTYGDTNCIEFVTSIDLDERQYNGRLEFVHDLQNAVYKETNLELTI